MCSESYQVRLSQIEGLQGPITAVTTARGSEAKRELLAALQARNAEGIVLKDASAPHRAGRPASGGAQRKFKFMASATCRVASRNGAKRSVALELLGESKKWTGVGNVTIPANYEIPIVGALVEVEYLYAYKGGSLYQPIYRGERDDLEESAASLKQLKYKPEASDEDDGFA